MCTFFPVASNLADTPGYAGLFLSGKLEKLATIDLRGGQLSGESMV
jgi:hypothetical protein